MKLVFAGTPEAALPSLDTLLRSRHEVAAVVTRPDAPAGRGRRIEPSPVAMRAREDGIEVLTPRRAGDPAFLGRLRQIGPGCCPVVAYGALLPQAALDIPPHGWVNLHFSVLPAWRGAAPVQHAILHGDDVTGVTTFRLVAELDAGPAYGVVTEPVRDRDTAGDLTARLARSGAELLVRTLDGIESGHLQAVPQSSDGVSVAPKITPEDARVDWSRPAIAIDRLIRACTPAPGAWTEFGGARLKLGPVDPGTGHRPGAGGDDSGAGRLAPGELLVMRTKAVACPGGAGGAAVEPGDLLVTRDEVFAGTGSWPVRLGEVQPQGKRWMDAADWARGLRLNTRQRPKLG